MVNRPNQCTNNTTLPSSSEVGCSFFLMGRWGWRFCPALIHNLPLSYLQLTSYTATNKKSHESECSYRFVSSQVKIDSLFSRNPRKLGKKKCLLVELTAYENDSDKRAPKKIRVIARLRKS